jgi:hypothetical protein
MKALSLLMAGIVCAFGQMSSFAAAKPTTADLLGKWEGNVEFGKFKFQLILRITKTNENRLSVIMDVPEQGARGIPVAAILFNSPDVRIEVDQFQTAYNGRLTDDLTEMRGEFEEGPGGRPMPVTFKRSTKPEEPEPERVFTFKPGEPRDIRGYWKSSIEAMPGMNITFALSIGRIPDGTFKVDMAVLEQGAKDIPASSVVTSNNLVEINWQALQLSFKGTLNDDASRMSGDWKQRGKPALVSFERLSEPATLIPKNVSYEADPNKPEDIRGHWEGKLDVPNQKLRLILKIGKTAEGTFAGSLTSPDQGPGELPMTSASVELPKVTMEWKAIRGKFEGTLTNNGSVMEGTWEQFGNKMPLKLERSSEKEGAEGSANNKKS